MNTENIFTLKRQAIIALAVATVFPAASFAAAGRVEFAIGGATAISKEGAARNLTKGGDINSGDTIKTTDGRVQVRFSDGGYMSLQPNTEFIVENYAYDGKQDGSERGFFRLVEGGLRAITGVVGRTNRPAYRVATPVATIGIRGSEFLAEHRDNRLKARVTGGSIFIENEFGDLILFKGQSAEAGEGEKPKYSEEESGVQAKGPNGGNPEDGENDSKQDRENSNAFAVNDIRNEDGTSCAVTNTCESILGGGTNIIAEYAAQNAYGYYSGSSTTLLNTGGKIVADGYLSAYFGDYSVSNDLHLDGYAPDGSGGYFYVGDASFSGNGSIGETGSISIPNLSLTANSGFCSSGCSVSGSGAFSGSAAEFANINYAINGINSSIRPSGSANIIVPYSAYYIRADGGEGALLYGNNDF